MSESPIIRVGDWTARPTLNRLERDGRAVKLEPRAMEVLVHLASRAGEVVSADELIDTVWDGRVVGDGAIYQSINQLRQALGDDGDEVRYIQTIRKRGYRLVAPVTTLEPEADAAVVGTRKLLLIIAAGLLLAVAVGFLVFDRYAAEPDRSVAVLPFENLSAVLDDEYFVAGIHNDLLTRLAKVGALKVISRTSVMEYAKSPRNLRQIGDELGVAAILEGSVQRAGDMVRINVQLIDTKTDRHLWAEVYDRDVTAENLFAIQKEMATSIAQALQATLSPQEVARLDIVPTQSTRAYEFYLAGNDYMRRGDGNYLSAAKLYDRAVTEDPRFALAWAALGDAYNDLYREYNITYRAWGGNYEDLDETEADHDHAIAYDAILRALELEPDLPEAHLALGNYHAVELEYDQALREFAIAEQGMPGDARVYKQRALALRRMGRLEEAIANFQRANEFDPRDRQSYGVQASVYWRLRDHKYALRLLDRLLEFAPDHKGARRWKAAMLLQLDGDLPAYEAALESAVAAGAFRRPQLRAWNLAIYERDYELALGYLDDWEADATEKAWFYGLTYDLAQMPELARPQFELVRAERAQAVEENPEDPWRLASLAEVLAYLGESNRALELAGRASDLLPSSTDSTDAHLLRIDVFWVQMAAEDFDAAIQQLDEYLANPGHWSIEGLLLDPRLDPIRDDAQFEAVVKKYRRQP